jgi:cob(I)alamin adenosyltransferase
MRCHDPERPADAKEPAPYDLTEEGRARKRDEQRLARQQAEGTKGLVIVNTGNGKGKTTAALGLLMRAWGRDLRVIMFQFIKAKTANWGEIRAARKMEVPLLPLGTGFTWTSKDIEHDRLLAQEGWERCREAIESGQYDVVIMDEMTYCFKYGWLDLDKVLDVLRHRPGGQHVVITGRHAPEKLIEFADLVTEMTVIKHPYEAGIKAQKGIEF